MKVYNKLVINIESGEVVYEDSFEYEGEIAHCGGGSGGSTTTTVDPIYNERMAAISERQQQMAEQYYKFYVENAQPVEAAQARTALGLQPMVEETQRLGLETQQAGLGLQKQQIAQAGRTIEAREPVMQSFYKQALEGVNVNQRSDQAGAEVANQFANVQGQTARGLARAGVDPNSGRGVAALTGQMTNQSRAIAGTRIAARNQAEAENFARLQGATALGISTGGTGGGGASTGAPTGAGGVQGYQSDASKMANQLMGQASNMGQPGSTTKETPASPTVGGAMLSAGSMAASGYAVGSGIGTAMGWGSSAGPYGALVGAGVGLLGYMLS